MRFSLYEFAEMRLRFIEDRIRAFVDLSQQELNALSLKKCKVVTSELLFNGELKSHLEHRKKVTLKPFRKQSFAKLTEKIQK